MLCIKQWAVCGSVSLVLSTPGFARTGPQFGTDPVSVHRALRSGQIEQALAYYERLAQEREKRASTSASSRGQWKAASEAFEAASRAARYSGQLQKSIAYGHKTLGTAEKAKEPELQLRGIIALIFAYRAVGKLERSTEIIGKGLEMAKKLPAQHPLQMKAKAGLYLELGRNLLRRRKYDEAIHYLTRALSQREGYLSSLYSSKEQKERYLFTALNGSRRMRSGWVEETEAVLGTPM